MDVSMIKIYIKKMHQREKPGVYPVIHNLKGNLQLISMVFRESKETKYNMHLNDLTNVGLHLQ